MSIYDGIVKHLASRQCYVDDNNTCHIKLKNSGMLRYSIMIPKVKFTKIKKGYHNKLSEASLGEGKTIHNVNRCVNAPDITSSRCLSEIRVTKKILKELVKWTNKYDALASYVYFDKGVVLSTNRYVLKKYEVDEFDLSFGVDALTIKDMLKIPRCKDYVFKVYQDGIKIESNTFDVYVDSYVDKIMPWRKVIPGTFKYKIEGLEFPTNIKKFEMSLEKHKCCMIEFSKDGFVYLRSSNSNKPHIFVTVGVHNMKKNARQLHLNFKFLKKSIPRSGKFNLSFNGPLGVLKVNNTYIMPVRSN